MSTIKAAFLQGLKDRQDGQPLIARFPDCSEEDAAYMCGYDPYQELGLVLPQFKAQVEAQTAALVRECCPLGIPLRLPRNACEFPQG